MDLPPALLQFAGSLIAILVIAALAYWMRLGAAPSLADESAARRAAEEALPGFEPTHLSLDRNGSGAIMRDANGRVLLLRQHGSHFAGRLLTPAARASTDGDTLVVDTAERRFGAVRLTMDDTSAWVQAITAIGSGHNA